MGKHHTWDDVDWSMTSAEIAEIKGCAKTTVDSARQRLAAWSRGRKRLPRVIKMNIAVWHVLDALCASTGKTQDEILSPIILALRPLVSITTEDDNA